MKPPSRKPAPKDSSTAARAARKQERRGRARLRQAFLATRAGQFDQRALDLAMSEHLARETAVKRAFPASDVRRWVPLGPSVVRRGQAEGRPRVTGRIRDLQVSADGRRAYAASAKGGVWYTDDAGSTWAPVGGWAERAAVRGGSNNAQTCGCLLVAFGAAAAQDYVLVGTGELLPRVRPFTSRHGGVGVLAAMGPAAAAVGGQPWEVDSGIAQLEGLGIFRMARHPTAVPGQAAGASADRVLAATSAGLFLGARAPFAGPPPRDRWTWTKLAGISALPGLIGGPDPNVSDVLWVASGAAPNGRMVIAVSWNGVAFSDDLGVSWAWATNLDPTTAVQPVQGRLSLANPAAARVYVLGEVRNAAGNNIPTLWQIPSVVAAPPAATLIGGVPPTLWGGQRDYDQAIAVDPEAAVDHVYLGGSTVQAFAAGEWSASLWCFDIPVPLPGVPVLAPAPNISTTGAPSAAAPTNAGADRAGLVGNNVHADVHAIRLAGAAGASRQVWVGCDGGVFVSSRRGRCNTFLPRVTGLAALEVGFFASHPSSSHFLAIGCQDTGTQARQGDTVWEMILAGDGGGTIFHPIHTQYVISQWTQATWHARPRTGYIDPVKRGLGGDFDGLADAREDAASAFYSGAAAVPLSPTTGRVGIGTNRVWISDDLDGAGANTWRTIGFPNGAAQEARPLGGTDPAARQGWGVPVSAVTGAGIGPVIQLRWVSARDLLALYAQGLVRYIQNPVTGAWTATVLIPDIPGGPAPATTVLTDVCPVPGSSDFYVTTTGDTAAPPGETCWFFNSATSTFHATGLRHALDTPGPPLVIGPLDPAYAVAVDPANPTDVYVGTVTGVWRSQRVAGTPNHGAWTTFVNGLPQATIQDLGFWTDPAGAASPRLLRAAIQSRGMWEVDLAGNEAQRTYARVHMRDDRRRLPTPMANPRLAPAAANVEPLFASPDVTVRPAANPAAAPTWQLGADTIRASNAPRYELWTFQTAFRWIYPSIEATGVWTDQMGDLVALHRQVLGMPAGRTINRDLWNAVVRNTHLDAAGNVTAVAGDPLAVYRAPWQSPAALAAVATEVDLMELVAPVSVTGDVWRVFRERCTVDVLVHHRDTRPLPPSAAFAVLLWRSAPNQAGLLALPAAGLQAYVQSLAPPPPPPPPPPPLAPPVGWNVVAPPGGGAGPPLHRLPVSLDARIPRAIPIDLDLSAVPPGDRVLLLAFVGSDVDRFAVGPTGPTATVSDLVQAWPYAAMRLVRMGTRP